jgi:hypothetical protein
MNRHERMSVNESARTNGRERIAQSARRRLALRVLRKSNTARRRALARLAARIREWFLIDHNSQLCKRRMSAR